MKIELILLGVIGLVFLVDFIKNSRKKPSIDNVVDQIENNEPFKQNSKFSYQFSQYKKINIVLLVLFLGLCFTPGKIIEYNENRIKKSFSDYELLANGHFIYQGEEYAFFIDNEFPDTKAIDEFKKEALEQEMTLRNCLLVYQFFLIYGESLEKKITFAKELGISLNELDRTWQSGFRRNEFDLPSKNVLKDERLKIYKRKVDSLYNQGLQTEEIQKLIDKRKLKDYTTLLPSLEKIYNSVQNGSYSTQNYAYTLNRIIDDAVSVHRLTAKDFLEKFPKLKMLTASSLKDFNENIVQLTQDESCTDYSYSTYPLVLSQNEYKINECYYGPLTVYDDFKINLFNKIFPETSNTNSHIKFYLILSLVFLFLFLINQFF